MSPDLLSLLGEGRTVSGQWLAKKLNKSRQALHKQIRALRGRGYRIDGKPHLGYRLARRGDAIFGQDIARSLRTKYLGKNLLHFESLDSTQDRAKAAAQKGAGHGTLVMAEAQTQGRGRMGREWDSARGGLWVSLVLRPPVSPQDVSLFALVASLSIFKVLRRTYPVDCKLKWPNDLVASAPAPRAARARPYRKLCGLLTEMSAESDRVGWVVLGFGLNANNPLPASLRASAVSLKRILGAPVDRAVLLRRILEQMEKDYDRFVLSGFSASKKEYERACVLAGQRVRVSNLGRETVGRYAGIADDGALVLEVGRRREKFYAGDVTLKPVHGP